MRMVRTLMTGIFLAVAAFSVAREAEERVVEKVETKTLAFSTQFETSRNVGPGRMVRRQEGRAGFIRRVWAVTQRNGKTISRRLLSEERRDPVHELYHVGRAGFAASRSNFVRGRVLTMTATAYSPDAGRGSSATFRTKTGRRAQFGVVAVDPRVIPLNTIVFVEGYGLALACDVGGAIRGNKIDLCVPTRREAIQFGRRKVRVHILGRYPR